MSKRLTILLMAVCIALSASVAKAQSAADNAKRLDALEKELAELKQQAAAGEGKGVGGLTLKYDQGLVIVGPKFEGKIGGRLQLDMFICPKVDEKLKNRVNQQDQPDEELFRTDVNFRRVYFGTEGTVKTKFPLKYMLVIDFAGNQVDLVDAWGQIQKLPVVQNVTIGRFKRPFSIDELTSNANTVFMERALPTGFAPGYATGVMIGGLVGKKMTWAVATTRPAGERGASWDATGRVTFAPVLAKRQVIHLGAAVNYSNVDADGWIGAQPEANAAGFFADSRYGANDVLNANNTAHIDDAIFYNIEFASVSGPLSAQAEINGARIDGDDWKQPAPAAPLGHGNANIWGGYVQSSYFITGESRPYDVASGCFGAVVPRKSFIDGGPGAWEVAIRYSYLDLDDGDKLRAGTLRDTTIGVNWYLCSSAKFMANYILANRSRWGTAHMFTFRFQVVY